MTVITFFSATTDEQAFFSQALSPHELHFFDTPTVEPRTEVLSVFVNTPVTGEMIEQMPHLTLIACRSTGTDHIDMDAAKARNIQVVNVPSYGAATVAEYTFTLLLMLSRRMPTVLQQASTAHADRIQEQGSDLNGKTMGIIGTGSIGLGVARIARGFGMEVLAYDVAPQQEEATKIGFRYADDIEQLLGQSDVISLHIPYVKETHHFLNTERLRRIKLGALIINTARGELIDTSALVKALTSGHIQGAALDVVESEHLLNPRQFVALANRTSDNNTTLHHAVNLAALQRLPNVIITNHNAYNTVEAIARINNTTLDTIRHHISSRGNVAESRTAKLPGKLVIARHGESEWNASGRWTGLTDVSLTEKGYHDAELMGQKLTDIHFDHAYVSEQVRTLQTMQSMLKTQGQTDLPFDRRWALNERDYGEYTGLNKWEVKQKLGEEMFNRIRRDWVCDIPGGETLQDVFRRVIPFYRDELLPRLARGENVLIVSHGNAIRALIKYIEDVSDEGIAGVEMIFGTLLLYEVSQEGRQAHKDTRTVETVLPPA